MSVDLQRGTANDAPELAHFGARTFREYETDTAPDDVERFVAEHYTEQRLRAELLDPRFAFFLARSGATLVGYANLIRREAPACVTGRNPVSLQRIYVERTWLGRGVGVALLERCLDEARNGGHDTLWLGVTQTNARAIRFYERAGFSKVGTRTFHVGEQSELDDVMEHRL